MRHFVGPILVIALLLIMGTAFLNVEKSAEVNYHPETGWLVVRGFKDSRVQGVVKKSTMPLLESLTPGPLES